MIKIFKYSFFDLIRSRWSLIYGAFYLVFTLALLFLSHDLSKVIISLMNVVLVLCPLIATMFGVMYYYNSREFVELLLAQPIRRRDIFWGQYLGLAASLSLSLLLGVGIPFGLYGIFQSAEIFNFTVLLLNGVFLSFIFSGIAFLIALRNEQKIKGFGLAIVAWLFFAVIYDGLLLLALMYFRDYPLERLALGASVFNPIDLSRVLILLKLDISALMGYTGAVFQKFMGTATGMSMALGALLLWVGIPAWLIRLLANRKDFQYSIIFKSINMQTIENSSLPTVGNIVAQDYRAAAVFKKFGIDFCCGGGKSVAKACADKGVDQAQVESALATLDQMPVPASRLDFNTWNLPFLADYIVNVHHRYVLDTVPQILAFAKKVAKVHGHAYPETVKIADLFTTLGQELLAHLDKEEQVLFPYIQRLWHTRSEHGKLIAPAFGSAGNPIRMMEMEHETAGEIMAEIRQLSNNFTPPESACNTYRVLYAMLEEFEQDLHQHVHLENNILFPKAMALEEEIISN